MSSDLPKVALTQYIAERTGTVEFEALECKTEYLLRLRANEDSTLKTLQKSFAKSGHQTDCIGQVLIVWLKPDDWFISSAISRYNEIQHA